MRALILTLLLISLIGCASIQKPVPYRDAVTIRVELVSDAELPLNVYGRADCVPDTDYCLVRLKKSAYPYCIRHEILRHPFEGKFHGDRISDEDCFPY